MATNFYDMGRGELEAEISRRQGRRRNLVIRICVVPVILWVIGLILALGARHSTYGWVLFGIGCGVVVICGVILLVWSKEIARYKERLDKLKGPDQQ